MATLGGALGNANFQEPGPADTSTPPITDPTDQPILSPVASCRLGVFFRPVFEGLASNSPGERSSAPAPSFSHPIVFVG